MNMTSEREEALPGTVEDDLPHKTYLAGEAHFLRLMDAMPQMVWIIQPDGWHSYFNQKWLDYTGSSLADSLGHAWQQFVHPDDSLRIASLCEHAHANGEPCEVEFRLRRADGVYRWMLSRASAQRDAATGQLVQWLGTLSDIEELKQCAANLESNMAINRIAGRVARLGGWTIELPGRVLTWSDENCMIHDVPPGYQPTLEEGLGYFLPEHRSLVMRHVQNCLEYGIPYEFVLPKRTAKGRLIWVRSIGEAVRDDSGTVIRIQGAFQDITQQHEAAAHMQVLEAQLITTLESITDGFFLMDKEWVFTFLNSQAERMLQRSRKAMLGKTLWQQFPGIVGTHVEHECRAVVQEQRTACLETFYPPLNAWFALNVYPTEAGVAVYFQDITERQREHAQLRLLETAVSRLNDMVIITDAQVLDEGGPRIVFVNDAFERQTGYSRQEVLGNTSRMLWGPKTRPDELARIGAAMSQWQAVRAEVVVYTKAGEELWLEADIAPIANESGQFTHWVAVERDITERRQQQQVILRLNDALQERVLARTAELATANQELESFAYSVSHDLRSPLNTIHAFSQLLLKNDGEQISDKGKHYLSRIGVGAKQMGDLIEGLLTLAHLSREQLKAQRVDLSAIARRIGQAHRTREPQRQAELFIQDGLSAHGDERLLSAVIHNLLGNAWKFTARQALARIDIGCDPIDDGDTVFFVKDNGAGFDMAFAPKLFGTFERLHSPDDFSGTGIGLATVKRIIERHGGRVWAEGKPNEGAMFFFTLGRGPAA